ncbi:MAG: hypothetical protein ACW981_08205 [Candidatus Hodarchaeales archaeon]|jgi:hypothetical protein
MNDDQEFFFRLPFILYPEHIPKSKYDAVEKASIALYIYDELKKSTFFKKGEKLKAVKKIYLPIALFTFEERGLPLSPFLIKEPLEISNYPTKLPILPEELEIKSYEDYINSLNGIYKSISSIETKKEVFNDFPAPKLIEDIEYLLHYPGMNQAITDDFNIIGIERTTKNISTRETFEHFNKSKSFSHSIKKYFEDYPQNKIDTTRNTILALLEESKREIYQEYELSLTELKKEISLNIKELETNRNQEIETLRKEYLGKKKNKAVSINNELKVLFKPVPELTLIEYDSKQFTDTDEYIKKINENLETQKQTWKKYFEKSQESVKSYKSIAEKEKERSLEINSSFDEKIRKENQKMTEREVERDNKLLKIEDKEKMLNNLIKGIKSVFNTKILEISLIQKKLDSIAINIENHPLKDSFLEKDENIIGLPFYLIHIESLEEPGVQRFVAIPPLLFPDLRESFSFSSKFPFYGKNPDQRTGHIAFKLVSNQLNIIASQILSNIQYYTRMIGRGPKHFLFTEKELNEILNEKNLLLDPLFETGVYNGLDWMNNTKKILIKGVQKKTKDEIIHFFDELNQLLLKQRGHPNK